MLTITPTQDPEGVSLLLEGRIVGEWVDLLETEVRALLERKVSVRIDCAGVVYLGSRGAEMLRRVESQGVGIVHCSPLIEAVLRHG